MREGQLNTEWPAVVITDSTPSLVVEWLMMVVRRYGLIVFTHYTHTSHSMFQCYGILLALITFLVSQQYCIVVISYSMISLSSVETETSPGILQEYSLIFYFFLGFSLIIWRHRNSFGFLPFTLFCPIMGVCVRVIR